MSESKARVGILGGSFDPIHFGHIKSCLALADRYRLNRIHLLPCKVSPFKNRPYASCRHRWNMVKLIAGSSDIFTADGRELERDAPSYAYTSLLELSEQYARQARLYWIMGMDALLKFPDWRQARQMMRLCHVLVLRRAGYTLRGEALLNWLEPYLCDQFAILAGKDCGHIFITGTQMVDVSSTQIRACLQAGRQPEFLLPGAVWNYIKRHNLYVRGSAE